MVDLHLLYTAGRLTPEIESLTQRQVNVHFASGVRCVIATLWKLYVLEIAADFDIEQNDCSPQVTSSLLTKYGCLSDKRGAQKRSVDQRTWRTKWKVRRAARLFCIGSRHQCSLCEINLKELQLVCLQNLDVLASALGAILCKAEE